MQLYRFQQRNPFNFAKVIKDKKIKKFSMKNNRIFQIYKVIMCKMIVVEVI